MGALITVCRPRKRIAPTSCTADQTKEIRETTPNSRSRSSYQLPTERRHQTPTQTSKNAGVTTPKEIQSIYENWRAEEAALDLDKSHVEKIKKREADGGAMTKDKFSKYSPLPDITKPPGRLLLRQKTYDVLNPVYVKGPSAAVEPKLKLLPRAKTWGKPESTSVKVNSAVFANRRPSELPNITSVKSSTVRPTVVKSKKLETTRSVRFLPKEVSTSDFSQSPAAFWCPI